MPKCETTEELLTLYQQFSDIRNMIGHLCTAHRNAVNYPDSPLATKKVQNQLNIASEFINVIYIYSILDEAGFTPENKWISSEDNKEFKAWVHIRHTGAHTPGSRAHRYKQDFNDFMESDQKSFSGLKQNCTWDETSITLADMLSHSFFQFSEYLIKKAIGYCANQVEFN